MGRLFVLLFLLPWWTYIPASIGVLWLGQRVYEQALETEADKAAALANGAPQAVDLTDFARDRDIHAADEVHVTGWIDADLNIELVKRRNGVPINTRFMYMMFGSADPDGASEVRAALMLTKTERDIFLDRGDDFIVGFTDANELVFAFNGVADTSVTLSGMAADAIAEQGLTKAADFVFVEPFFNGREAALAPHGVPDKWRYIGWLIAAAVALIGVVKRIISVRARPSRDELEAAAEEPAEASALDPGQSHTAPVFTLPEGVSDDTPLGRLARGDARSTVPSLDADPAPPVFADPVPDPKVARRDGTQDPLGPRAQGAPVFDSGADRAPATESRFPPVPDTEPAPAEARGSSDIGFYAKLALAMLVVGGIAYKPSVIAVAMPFASVALFWLGVYVVFRKIRNRAARLPGGNEAAPQHQRRPEGGAQTVAVGVGGHQIDLTAPGRSPGRERGVI